MMEVLEIKRMWINQPSSNSHLNKYHGQRVLAVLDNNNQGIVKVYFTEGSIISMVVPANVLSNGWRSVGVP